MVRLFGGKKEESVVVKQSETIKETDLDRVCADDKDVCKALWHTMFLNPRKISSTLMDAEKKAISFEKKRNIEKARIWYHIAGGLALWEGDSMKVKRYFSKCAELAPEMNYEPIVNMPKRAVEKAKEYYESYLK